MWWCGGSYLWEEIEKFYISFSNTLSTLDDTKSLLFALAAAALHISHHFHATIIGKPLLQSKINRYMIYLVDSTPNCP